MSRPGRRRPVFDPGGLDDLEDVLAPPQPPPATPRPRVEGDEAASPAGAAPSTVDPPTAGTTGTTASAERGGGPTRGRGASTGRVTASPSNRQPRAPGGRVPTAVRLPAELYQQVNQTLLSGLERPSYGQLVMWTVEDHREAVATATEQALPDPSQRAPRGRRLAQDRVPVGLQLLMSERQELDELAESIAARCGSKVTRTDVVTAALRVAVRERVGSRD